MNHTNGLNRKDKSIWLSEEARNICKELTERKIWVSPLIEEFIVKKLKKLIK